MSGYRDWLWARSCESCRHGGEVTTCAGWVWVDGERVRCTCHGVEAILANDSIEITPRVFGQDEATDAGDSRGECQNRTSRDGKTS